MKRTVQRTALLSMLALASLQLRAATPTQADLDSALTAAQTAWGIRTDVAIRLDHSEGCEIMNVQKKHFAFTSSRPATSSAKETLALTQAVETKMITTPDDPSQPPTVTSFMSWVITVNAACDWNEPYLHKVVMHEYGHALGLQHSADRSSIMYWMVFTASAERVYGNQSITAQDLASATTYRAQKQGEPAKPGV